MSKRTHDRQLARARAKRQADLAGRRRRRQRIIASVLVGAMAIAAVGVAIALRDPATPEVADDPPATPEASATDVAAAEPCPPPGEDVPEPDATLYDEAPQADLGGRDELVATMETTCGTITLSLNAEAAPRTVSNFVALARDDYYQGVAFHRVIDGFMIQGGDPAGTGCGQPDCSQEGFDPEAPTYPGYEFEDELSLAEQLVEEQGGYPRGTLAMANSGADTNGSQFFIVQSDAPLPASYTAFGEATGGMDVVDRIAVGPTDEGGDAPEQPVRILDVEIQQS